MTLRTTMPISELREKNTVSQAEAITRRASEPQPTPGKPKQG